jgi:hypothetical protein
MLNFGDVFVFEKEIEVQNISNESKPEPDTKKKRKDNPNEKVITREDVEIEFFPESGSLISGIENTVAFKAADWSGRGVDVSGGVLSSNGDTVATFTSEYLGMGKFVFTPQAGESYHAFFVPKNMAYSLFAKLPEPLDKGFTVNITDNDTAFVINVRTNPESFNEFLNKTILLAFRQSEKPLFGHEMTINKLSEILYLSKSLLPAGITRITLYDEQEKPHCERLVYIENKEKINADITPANDTVSTITITDNRGEPVQSNLSMSITNSIVPDETFNIESYFWLESEVKGRIEQSAKYFDTTDINRFKNMDLLLLTQGWRDFVWKHVENNASTFAGHEMEKGLKITGNVKKLIGNKPYPNANISMYAPHLGVRKGTRFIQTDSLGNYNFGYMNFFGYKPIHFSSRTEKGKEAGEISINPPSMPVEEFPVKIWKQYQIDSAYTLLIENHKKREYKLTDTTVLDPVTISDRKDGHLISDREISPRDDSLWMSLDFYLKGQAPALITARMPSKILNDLKITFYDSNGKRMKSKVPHPSTISMKEVDRVRIYRKSEFLKAYEVPPGDLVINYTRSIYSVDVYSKHAGFTEQNYNTTRFKQEVSEGSRNVSFKSGEGYYEELTSINFEYYGKMPPIYEGSARGLYKTTIGDVDYSSISPLVGGFYEERKFYSPEFHSTAESKDYFGTYFWQADVSTDATGKGFVNYNPEKQPSGKIRIEGITNKGVPFAVKLK